MEERCTLHGVGFPPTITRPPRGCLASLAASKGIGETLPVSQAPTSFSGKVLTYDKPANLGDAFTRFVPALQLCHDFDITLFRRTRREIWIALLNILSSVKCDVNMAPGYAGC
ncbi:hypothetical protein WN51_13640 [Melipona quadrifasciata]|uniref:Uncharacterized protein n=1 Tax=Melipona quadrifasciata TaxID=166423 RepID=A0A0N0U5M8_9HYME|nr:hypothetical protein WN51_13640 [Melipona quadrifasciata]